MKHLRPHSGAKLFICDVCGLSSVVESGLKRHLRTHISEKPFKCDWCGRVLGKYRFENSICVLILMRKLLSCDVCGLCSVVICITRCSKLHVENASAHSLEILPSHVDYFFTFPERASEKSPAYPHYVMGTLE